MSGSAEKIALPLGVLALFETIALTLWITNKN